MLNFKIKTQMAKKSEQNTEKNEVAPQPKRTTLTSAATFWDFKKEPFFEGQHTGNTVQAEQDDPDNNRKKGDIMGYEFVDDQGEIHIIGNSFQMEKAMEKCKSMGIEKPYLIIEFKGTEKLKKSGRQFNRFSIELLED